MVQLDERRLLARFRAIGRPKGRELLLRHTDALRLLRECEHSGLPVLGMDFYRESGDDVVETLAPADYSSLADDPDAARTTAVLARALIAERLPDDAQWVSFVLGSPRRGARQAAVNGTRRPRATIAAQSAEEAPAQPPA